MAITNHDRHWTPDASIRVDTNDYSLHVMCDLHRAAFAGLLNKYKAQLLFELIIFFALPIIPISVSVASQLFTLASTDTECDARTLQPMLLFIFRLNCTIRRKKIKQRTVNEQVKRLEPTPSRKLRPANTITE